MKNRFLLMAWALVLCTAPVHLRAEVVVSVLYFENLRGDMEAQWISKGIADSLISELSQVEGLAIVEREELQNVIEEQQLGRILNARFLVSRVLRCNGTERPDKLPDHRHELRPDREQYHGYRYDGCPPFSSCPIGRLRLRYP
ncbi:MAG: CsgG/HfaB family protein [Spirochaetota bacterium]|nr:CsgG/HfaB family protein [Spirochaetota bacterium]